ncbi:peptidyl-prolyl cis-trans isomerase [Catenovulum sediminis]|uniref:peptidylprolyl isomerase n=2 Tax=Catenovulum sediminis TaxID=1740262 RepID=A0ABV1RJD5_9ALTE
MVGVLAVLIYQNRMIADHYIGETLVAEVGSKGITLSEFNKVLAQRGGQYQANVDVNALLDEMVLHTAIVQYAKQHNQDKLFEYQQATNNLLIGKIKEQFLNSELAKITVSDAEIEAFYRQNHADFTQAEQTRVAMIYQALSENQEKQRTLLQQVSTSALEIEIANGFGALAVEYSDHQASRYRGGHIGWFKKDLKTYLPVDVVATTYSLDIGQTSDVIKADDGYYLFRLLDKRESSVKPLQKVKAEIHHKIIVAKQKDMKQRFENKMLSSMSIIKYLDNLPELENTKKVNEHPPSF